jgi:hypothetical protein
METSLPMKQQISKGKVMPVLNTLWTGDTDLRLYITTVKDG